MKAKSKFRGYAGRFVLLYTMVYIVTATVFVAIQDVLPEAWRIALDFFKPYRAFDLLTVLAQGLRAGVMALVLYPFYRIIVRDKDGLIVLFGALWGLAILGSLEPPPGTIEGMIYTETTAVEHLLVLAAGAVQVMVFCRVFLKWENRSSAGKRGEIHE